ncbi:hypothetical protein [Vibrio crassostreae]|uniref:hypothetical protein n=1 Tax=Vibrio crassostreae TaxID=246167 RepID=UPI001B301C5E|nr:hypothetical protein [Vibrio crassostreae]
MENNKKPLIIFAITLLAAMVLYAAFFYTSFGKSRFGAMQYVTHSTLLKHHRAGTIEGRKIVVTGSSETNFGINSKLMGELTGLPTVSLGVIIYRRPEYLFDEVLQHVKRGDIVIVSMARVYYDMREGYLHEVNVRGRLASGKDFFERSSLVDKLDFITQVPPRLLLERFINPDDITALNPVDMTKELKGTPEYGAYDYRRMTPEMDVSTGDKLLPTFMEAIKEKGYMQPMPTVVTDYSVSIFEEFRSELERRGVTLYLTHPPVVDGLEYDVESHKKLSEKMEGEGFEYLCKREDFVYDLELFYDFPPHLNAEGARLRSEKLASCLLLKIGGFAAMDK